MRSVVGKRCSVAVVVALTCLLAGCGSGPAGPTNTEGAATIDRSATLRIGQNVSPTTWDPIGWPTVFSAALFVPYVYDQIVSYGPDLKVRPMLATGWESAADGMSTTFTLRTDVTFHDGSPLDASVVSANLERVRKTPAYAEIMSDVSSIEAPDSTTVVVRFTEPTVNFVELLAFDLRMSSVVNPRSFADPKLRTAPQGSGPYLLQSSTQQKSTFQRVERHWDTTSGMSERIEVMSLTDPNSRMNALRTGQVQLAYLTADQVPAARAGDLRLVEFRDSPSAQALMVRYSSGAVADWRVRKAISLALDREALARVAYPDACTPTRQLFSVATGSHDPSADSEQGLRPDLAAAKDLMRQAGHERITVKMLIFAGNSANANLAQLVQRQLAPLGITVELTTQPVQQASIAFADGQFDLYASTTSGTPDSQTLLDANLVTRGRGFGIPDYISEPRATAMRMPLGPERDNAYKAINQKLIDQPAHILICNQTAFVGASNKVVAADSITYGRMSQGVIDARRIGLSN